MIVDSISVRGKKNFGIYVVVIILLLITANILIISTNVGYSSQEISIIKDDFKVDLYKNLLLNSNKNLAYVYSYDESINTKEYRYNLLFQNFPMLSYLYRYEDISTVNFSKEVYPIREVVVSENHNEEDIDYNSEMFNEIYHEEMSNIYDDRTLEASNFNVDNNSYSLEQLNNYEFLVNNLYTVDSRIIVDEGEFDIQYFLTNSMHVDIEKEEPTILIYHTHSQESFVNTESDEVKTVVDIGNELTRILQKEYGISVYHLKGEYDIIDGVLDRSKAYELIQPDLQKILDENPSIELMIDVHRDGLPESVRLVTEIDGKPTAKIMFFNGLSKVMNDGEMVEVDYMQNPYVKDNMALSMQMQLKANELYDGFTRKIYLKGYRYNLHFLPKSMLIEVGAQNNTYEEAFNAMAPLAKVLYEVIK